MLFCVSRSSSYTSPAGDATSPRPGSLVRRVHRAPRLTRAFVADGAAPADGIVLGRAIEAQSGSQGSLDRSVYPSRRGGGVPASALLRSRHGAHRWPGIILVTRLRRSEPSRGHGVASRPESCCCRFFRRSRPISSRGARAGRRPGRYSVSWGSTTRFRDNFRG